MRYLDLPALDRTPLAREPYDHLMVEHFIRPDVFAQVSADYPATPGPGSHPPSELKIAGHFAALMDELLSDDFRAAIEAKFGVDLVDRPTMYTVRGFVREKDGAIHTDSKTKIVTVLLYMNEGWESDGGRLRILRSGDDLDDFHAEVPPNGGTLLAFLRSDRSWHGHKPFAGPAPRHSVELGHRPGGRRPRTEPPPFFNAGEEGCGAVWRGIAARVSAGDGQAENKRPGERSPAWTNPGGQRKPAPKATRETRDAR